MYARELKPRLKIKKTRCSTSGKSETRIVVELKLKARCVYDVDA